MFHANLKILSEVKSFLQIVSNNEEYLSIFRKSETDFTRKRKLTFDKLVLLIARLCKKTLSVEIDDFFGALNFPKSCSVSAFSLQRAKMSPAFFYYWNMTLWMSFYHHYGNNVKRWKGRKVIACDGSNVSLVNRPELSEHFGGQSNQTCSFVQAKTFYCYDVLNKMILFPQIVPYRYGELNVAYDILTRAKIEEDMLMIYDRNFSNYKMAALHQWQEKEIKYVIRVKDSLLFAKKFIRSKKQFAVITLFPTINAINGLKACGYIVNKSTPLKVRLVRIKLPDGTIEILMTNLWEEENISIDEFKKLYGLRWGVESSIGFQKNVLQMESFSGLTANSVIQDFYATVFIANLHSLLTKPAQEMIDKKTTHRKHPMQINHNKAFGKIKTEIVSLFVSKKPGEILKILHDYFTRFQLPIRKDRSFPRIRKNRQSNSKHRTFTNYKPAY